ncbi:hypothetical protein ACFL0X_02070 [Nanoarchaeota archaeon]
MKRSNLVLIGSCFLLVLVLGIVNHFPFEITGYVSVGGEECSVVLREECEEAGEYVVMGLSSRANAHAELYDEGNYDYVLCCGFAGTRVCSGTNEILSLSSETNAHVEVSGLNYNYPVCYGNVDCESGASCGVGNSEILSLSSETNAHVGVAGEYSVKVCCDVESVVGECELLDSNWDKEFVVDGEEVNMSVVAQDCEGEDIEFTIFEDDGLVGDDLIFSVVSDNEVMSWTAVWTYTAGEFGPGYPESDDDDSGWSRDYYFKAKSVDSGSSVESGILEVSQFWDSGIDLCAEYINETNCLENLEDIGIYYGGWEVYSTNCKKRDKGVGCVWTSRECLQNMDVEYHLDNAASCEEESVSCNYREERVGNCEVGETFFTVNYVATTNNPLCELASRNFPCLSEIKLGFFSWFNFVITLVLVFGVYFVLREFE